MLPLGTLYLGLLVIASTSNFHCMAFFPSLKQFYCISFFLIPDCILKFTSCDNQALVECIPIPAVAVPFEPEIIKIGQSSHIMCSNNIVNFQVSVPIVNA